LLARVLQHEIDHLNGVLIIDHAEPVSAATQKAHAELNGKGGTDDFKA
jgi:peptide deformylase